MPKRHALILLFAGLLLTSPLPLLAKHGMQDDGSMDASGVLAPYAVADKVDLTTLLAPPPGPDSEQTKAELEDLLRIQAARTDAQSEAAIADHAYDVFRFENVLGPKFNAADLPLTKAFFDRVVDTGKAVIEPAKDFWDRERPGVVDSRIEPILKEPKSGSYPSGHSTAGNLMAIVLANLLPEKAPELYARGWDFAHNRLVAGAHFPSDIQAGRIAAAVIASHLFRDPEFRKDYAAARTELRAALGYPTSKP